MGLFHKVDDAFVILLQNGVHKQRPVYTRADRLYAGIGSDSFIALHSRGTSKPDVSWDEIFGVDYAPDELGRLVKPVYVPEQKTGKGKT